MDIRGDGGYAIFIGERNGKKYEWLRDPQPHPFDAMPENIREFLSGKTRANGKTQGEGRGEGNAEELMRRALELVTAQGRNVSGFWLATQLRDNQYSYEAALNVMQSYRSRCPTVITKGEPEEYTESEILATLKQAYDRPPRSPWAKQNGRTSKGSGPATAQAEDGDGEAAEDKHGSEDENGFTLTDQGVFHTHYEKDRETGKARPVTVYVCSPLEALAYSRDVNSEA